MLFNSFSFLIFFIIAVVTYFIIPPKIRCFWLVILSYYFYMVWNPKYAIVLAFSTIVAYAGGILIDDIRIKSRVVLKKVIFILCLICNVGLLIAFKYSQFIVHNMNRILTKLGHEGIQITHFVMVVGISFYTFQVIGYLVDVYREKIVAEKNIIKFSLLVSFFPKLLSGPIEDSKSFLEQVNDIENVNVWNYKRIVDGGILIIWGVFVKMVIADRISILVNTVFDSYKMYYSVELFVAAIAYSIQIYCDFMSYSIVAVGTAQVLGFVVTDNFDTPYFAISIKDFWRRWHISLSIWLREYIYIPFGGNRKSKFRKYINLMLTFLISGIWHGANWNFIVWGGLHGLYQVSGEVLCPIRKKITSHMKTDCFSFKIGQIMFTFFLTTIAWIFFRVNSISDGFYYIERMFTKINLWALSDGTIYTLGLDRVEANILLISLAVLCFVDVYRYLRKENISMFLSKQNLWFRWISIFALIFAILIFGEWGGKIRF